MTAPVAALALRTAPAEEAAPPREKRDDGRFATLVADESSRAKAPEEAPRPQARDRKRKAEPESTETPVVALPASPVVSPALAPATAAPTEAAAGASEGASGAIAPATALPAAPASAQTLQTPPRKTGETTLADLIVPQEADAKAAGAQIDGVRSIKGATVLSDGSDPAPVAAGSTTPKLDVPAPLAPPAAASAPATAAAGQSAEAAKTDGDALKPAGKSADDAKPANGPAADPAAGAGDPGPATEASSSAPGADRASPDRGPAPASPPQAPTPAVTSSAQAQPTSALASAAAAQVGTEIATHAGARRTRFEVRLDPGELGRVDVRLDIGHDGRISTRLIVEKVETLDMLKQDARELTRTLEQAGFQLGQGGLAFQLKDGRQDVWRQEPQGRTAKAAVEEIDEAAPAASVYARASRSGASGVDMTV